MLVFNALQLIRDQIQCLVPRDRDERLDPATGPVAMNPLLQIPLAHHGLRDTARVIDGTWERLHEGRRVRIVGKGLNADEDTVFHLCIKKAPMRTGMKSPCRHTHTLPPF